LLFILICGKTKALNDLGKELGVEITNLNLLLSKQLLEMTPKQRSLQLTKIIENTIRGEGDTIILDNIELLFENLKCKPNAEENLILCLCY